MNQKFITVFTTICHCTLLCARWTQSTSSYRLLNIQSSTIMPAVPVTSCTSACMIPVAYPYLIKWFLSSGPPAVWLTQYCISGGSLTCCVQNANSTYCFLKQKTHCSCSATNAAILLYTTGARTVVGCGTVVMGISKVCSCDVQYDHIPLYAWNNTRTDISIFIKPDNFMKNCQPHQFLFRSADFNDHFT
jgi:hypothetical protein